MKRFRRVAAGLVAGLAVLASTPVDAKEKKHVVERFRANAMNIDTARATIVEIGIMEWTSAEERQALVDAFNEGGTEGAYKHLSKQEEKAYVRGGTTVAYQMRYAYQLNNDGKRQIVLATDRPMSFGEVMSGSSSQDDSISLVILQLHSETGEGDGEIIFGAGFEVKDGKLSIETLSQNPTKLSKVRAEQVKHKD